MNRLVASSVFAALALFSGVRPADARELTTNPSRQVCKVDGRRIPCRLVFKCRAAGGDDILRTGQRWLCCDTMVNGGPCRGLCEEPPQPLPSHLVRCFDLVREDGFAPNPLDGTRPDLDDLAVASVE